VAKLWAPFLSKPAEIHPWTEENEGGCEKTVANQPDAKNKMKKKASNIFVLQQFEKPFILLPCILHILRFSI